MTGDTQGLASSDSAPKYRYCTAIVERWSIPHCVGELTREQQRRRGLLTRLVEREGLITRVDTINGSSSFYWETPKVTSTELVYEGTRVVELVGLDRNGIIRKRTRVAPTILKWSDSGGRPKPDDESSVSGAEQRLDEQGRVIELRYIDAAGAPAQRTDGVSSVRYTYGQSELVEDESYFSHDGAPQTNTKGVHRIATEYDRGGLELSVRYLDDFNRPLPDKNGVQCTRTRYDAFGNSIEVRDFDQDGRPRLSDGTAICRLTRDESGREIEIAFFDDHGAPAMSEFGYVARRQVHNSKGLVIEWSFADGNGNPARVRGSEHSIRRRVLDDRDRPAHESSFDTDGKPFTIQGSQQNERTFDDRDNAVLRTYLTENGAPTKAEDDHFSILRQTFDVYRLVRT
jgi:hypothetical protein